MSSTLVTQLQHDKEVLERQLDEVSNECGRLQVWGGGGSAWAGWLLGNVEAGFCCML